MMAGSGTAALRDASQVLLRVVHLVRTYQAQGGRKVHALSDVSFDVAQGETLGVVGESGCGKSTLARSLLMLPPPSSGAIHFQGELLTMKRGEQLRQLRPRLQMIFQDPLASLNPRHSVLEIVTAPLLVNGIGSSAERTERVREALASVGLDAEVVGMRRPHELSGGQCQRVSIARALVLRPVLLICDEPVSSLDVSVQAQVINLLEAAKAAYALTMLFISHDLAVIKTISDRVMVMYLGKVCELGPVASIYSRPKHPYTATLLEAIPIADPALARRSRKLPSGETPSPLAIPSGCRFHTRCAKASDLCRQREPEIRGSEAEGYFACHHPLE
jgi:peptide/nickel transport system ATP-binding protein